MTFCWPSFSANRFVSCMSRVVSSRTSPIRTSPCTSSTIFNIQRYGTGRCCLSGHEGGHANASTPNNLGMGREKKGRKERREEWMDKLMINQVLHRSIDRYSSHNCDLSCPFLYRRLLPIFPWRYSSALSLELPWQKGSTCQLGKRYTINVHLT